MQAVSHKLEVQHQNLFGQYELVCVLKYSGFFFPHHIYSSLKYTYISVSYWLFICFVYAWGFFPENQQTNQLLGFFSPFGGKITTPHILSR